MVRDRYPLLRFDYGRGIPRSSPGGLTGEGPGF